MSIHFKNDWETPLQGEFQKDYYRRLHQFLLREYRTQTVYPNMYDIFNAFHYTAYQDTKVCIIGILDWAKAPQRMKTTGFSRALSRRIAWSVKVSHPRPRWDAA